MASARWFRADPEVVRRAAGGGQPNQSWFGRLGWRPAAPAPTNNATAATAAGPRPVEVALQIQQHPIAEARIIDAERAAENATIDREIACRS